MDQTILRSLDSPNEEKKKKKKKKKKIPRHEDSQVSSQSHSTGSDRISERPLGLVKTLCRNSLPRENPSTRPLVRKFIHTGLYMLLQGSRLN